LEKKALISSIIGGIIVAVAAVVLIPNAPFGATLVIGILLTWNITVRILTFEQYKEHWNESKESSENAKFWGKVILYAIIGVVVAGAIHSEKWAWFWFLCGYLALPSVGCIGRMAKYNTFIASKEADEQARRNHYALSCNSCGTLIHGEWVENRKMKYLCSECGRSWVVDWSAESTMANPQTRMGLGPPLG